jgi:hypothetical protein
MKAGSMQEQTAKNADRLSIAYNLAGWKWQGRVFVEVLIMKHIAAGGDLLCLQHTCLAHTITHTHTHTEGKRERALGEWRQIRETQDEQ